MAPGSGESPQAGRGDYLRRRFSRQLRNGRADPARHGLPAAFYVTVGSIGDTHIPWFCRLRQAFHSTSARHWTDPDSGRECRLCDNGARREAFLAACRVCAALTGDRQEVFLARVDRELQIEAISKNESLMMNWEQVAGLHRAGHIVGSHTMTHPNLAYSAAAEARREMQNSKDILERQLAAEIRHFSYPRRFLNRTIHRRQPRSWHAAATFRP